MPTLDEPFEIAYWGITIKVTPVINGSETSICITFDFRAAANICRIANKLGGRISISSKLYNNFSVFSLNGRFNKMPAISSTISMHYHYTSPLIMRANGFAVTKYSNKMLNLQFCNLFHESSTLNYWL